jgi:hypothetical protein
MSKEASYSSRRPYFTSSGRHLDIMKPGVDRYQETNAREKGLGHSHTAWEAAGCLVRLVPQNS